MQLASNGRAVFKVRGGALTGLGNTVRSVELARSMQAAGFEVLGFHSNESPAVQDIIRGAGFPTFTDGLRELCSKADVLVIDESPAQLNELRFLPSLRDRPLTVALDFFEYAADSIDLIVNITHHGMVGPAPGHCLEGVEFAIVRDAIRAYVGKPVGPSVGRILICFGGSDPAGNTCRTLTALKTIASGVPVDVVVGPCVPSKDEIQAMMAQLPGAELHLGKLELGPLMSRCDLAITGGGVSLMELLSLSRPCVVVAQNQNEARLAQILAEKGALLFAGLADEADEQRIAHLTGQLLASPGRRSDLSRRAGQLIDGQGRDRLVELILTRLSERRGAYA